MKKLICMVLLISIVVGMLPVTALAETAHSVEAVQLANQSDNYIEIYSAEDLLTLSDYYGDYYFVLMKDIVFNPSDFEEGGPYYNEGKGWEPVELWGSFDGNNHTIKGIKMSSGLFTAVNSDRAVYDLTIADAEIVLDDESIGHAGTIAQWSYGEITNCYVSGNISDAVIDIDNVSANAEIGGIVGVNYGVISKCTSDITFTLVNAYNVARKVGGITGFNSAGFNHGIIEECKNIGEIVSLDVGSYDEFGGIVGHNYSGQVINCENYAPISVKAADKGAIVGGIAGENGSTIDSCKNYGDLEATGILGGIVGQDDINGECVIRKSENNGNLNKLFYMDEEASDTVSYSIGGIVGRACGIVELCTNNGSVTGGTVGGIAGRALLATQGDTSIAQCFNYGSVEVLSENSLIPVGGIVGEITYSSRFANEYEGCFEIVECYNSGAVTGTYASLAGGIVGSIDDSSGGTHIIERCCNVGEINSFANQSHLPIGSGGIIGTIQTFNDSATIAVKDVYNLGTISVENEDNTTYKCSGLIGRLYNSGSSSITVENSYNMGNVLATESKVSTSALFGDVNGSPTGSLNNLYYLESGLSAFGFSDSTLSIGNIKELTIEEFADESNFIGFDFNTVWAMSETNGYPYLQALGEGNAQPDANALKLLYQYPQNNATGIVNTTANPLTITMTFNKEVESVADSRDGKGNFAIYRQLENDLTATLVYTLSDKDSEVKISGSTVTIDVSKANLVNNSTYYITMGPNVISFKDTDETIAFLGKQWMFKTGAYAQGDYAGMYGSTFSYDDSYFLGGNSSEYNHDLALASCNLAISAFNSDDAKASDYQADVAGSTVKKMLMQLGFAEDDVDISSYEGKPTKNSIAAAIASKTINLDDEEWTLIAVAVRGGGYESEWGGNFVLNSSGKHAGFNMAANQVYEYLKSYVQNHDIWGNIAIWVTGYSRAAATANLLAAKLNDGYLLNIDRNVDPSDIYTYTFETPMGEVDSDAYRYSNIFNIVNPIDIVPLVAPSKWNFTRNGIDCYLPSSENTSRYGDYLDRAGTYYTAFSGNELPNEFVKYKLNILSDGLLYNISNDINGPTHLQSSYMNQIINTDLCTDLIPSREKYVDDLQTLLSDLVVVFAGHIEVNHEALSDIVLEKIAAAFQDWLNKQILIKFGSAIVLPFALINLYNIITKNDKKELAKTLTNILIDNGAVRANESELEEDIYNLLNIKEFLLYAICHFDDLYTLIKNYRWLAVAHEPQFCLAWMNTVNSGFMSNENYKKTRYLTVNCPVDLQVYDSEGVLVASIVNDQVVRIEDSTIDAYIDANEQKIVALPTDETYQIEITATGIGVMTYSVSEYDFSQGAVTRLVNYYDLPLEDGTTYSGTVEALEGNEANYPLKKGSGEYLPVSEELNGEEVLLYAVAADVVGNGVAAGGGWFHRGEYAKVTAIPAEGENFLVWYVNGQCVSTDAEYRFLVTEDTTVSAHFTSHTDDTPDEPSTSHVPSSEDNSASEREESNFSDVSASEWYYTAVQYVVENGLMNGTSSTLFAPNATLTRAMLVQVLYNLEGKPAVGGSSGFTDVASGAWYADAVAWAAEHGIVTGYSETRFGPNDAVTREQTAAIFQRYARYKGYDASASGDLSQFTDAKAVSAYAKDAVIWAVDAGLLSGKGNGTLDPAGTATRAEIAAVLMRFCENVLQ